MSDPNQSEVLYGLDSCGRIVRVESGVTRSNINRFPSIEETLRRIGNNLRSDGPTSESNNGTLT